MTEPLNALVVVRASTAESRGGPGHGVRMMLKAYEATSPRSINLTAVFGDAVVNPFSNQLGAIGGTSNGAGHALGRVGSLLPHHLRFAIGYTLSLLRFAFNLGIALLQRRGRKVLHAHDITSGFLALLLTRHRSPIVLTVHGKGGYVREPMLKYPKFRGTVVERFWRWIERTTVTQADVVVFTSTGSRELFDNEYPGLTRNIDVRIVPSGIDTEELDSISASQRVVQSHDTIATTVTVVCAAKLIEDRGLDVLIEAVALLPEDIRARLFCLLLGDGYLRDELENLATHRGLQSVIKFPGFLPREEFLHTMKAATLFVMPTRVSVFDHVLLEAAAMKLPIVTTATGGNLEMFDKDTAILVPPNDPQALADAIMGVVSDGQLRQRLGENACYRIRTKFSLEAMFSSYIAIYRELISPPQHLSEGKNEP